MSRRFASILRNILGPRGRHVLCWVCALVITGVQYYQARVAFGANWHAEAAQRVDRHIGHVLIDFGGQWLMGRMLVAGHGHELYSRPVHWEELQAAYPRADEVPGQEPGDAQRLFLWMVDLPTGQANEPPPFPPDPLHRRVGGPLYPPTHALLFAPIGLLQPRHAFHLIQALSLVLAWLAGAAIAGISRGRLWWPAATVFLMLFPGFHGALNLAQNSVISLAILAVGWYLVSLRWDFAGGAVWALLAYKPVWAVAFLLVPLVCRRWRMLAGLVAGGVVFVAATLPLVGLHAWLTWLRIGQEAAHGYDILENWIFLSRDLFGFPRRVLLEFKDGIAIHDRTLAAIIGWGVWFFVVSITIAVSWRRRDLVRSVDGYGAAFVCIGAWASCLHFIYYDVTLAALPVALLLTDPRRFIRPTIVAVTPAPDELTSYLAPEPMERLPPDSVVVTANSRSIAVLNSLVLTCVAVLILIELGFQNLSLDATVSIGFIPVNATIPNTVKLSTQEHGTPWDTMVLLVLWAYCAIWILRVGEPND